MSRDERPRVFTLELIHDPNPIVGSGQNQIATTFVSSRTSDVGSGSLRRTIPNRAAARRSSEPGCKGRVLLTLDGKTVKRLPCIPL